MVDDSDPDDGPPTSPAGNDAVDDVPSIACGRCGQEWTLAYELDDLGLGNQAVEQFALDHMRHTGHFPDGVSTWRATCRRCPEGVDRLSERAAVRWARTHARHTRHPVEVAHATADERTLVEPPIDD